LWLGASDVVQENATFEQQWCCTLACGTGAGVAWCQLPVGFLQQTGALPALAAATVGSCDSLFAAKNDLLEQEDVVLAVHVALGDCENVVEEKLAEVGDVVAFPVFDAGLECLHRLTVVIAALGLVDLVGNALDGGIASLELIDQRVVSIPDSLDEFLWTARLTRRQ